MGLIVDNSLYLVVSVTLKKRRELLAKKTAMIHFFYINRNSGINFDRK